MASPEGPDEDPVGSVRPAKRIVSVDELLASPKRPSAAKIAANRKNALKSTGPRSGAGKARSSQNALKHSHFAQKLVAITVGPYAEDADEVAAFIQEAIDVLAPRDYLEMQVAQQIAVNFLRQQRLMKWEGGQLDAVVPIDDYERGVAANENTARALQAVLDFAQLIATGESRDAADFAPAELWREMGAFVYARLKAQQWMRDTGGSWRLGADEQTAGQWAAQFAALVNENFDKLEQFESWLAKVAASVHREITQANSATLGQIAQNSIAVVERNVVTQARITNELARQLAFYEVLKSRPLAEGGRSGETNPNSTLPPE